MKQKQKEPVEQVTVSSAGLETMLGCGHTVAQRIGTEAGAKIKIGGRVLWDVAKIKEYLAQAAEVDKE